MYVCVCLRARVRTLSLYPSLCYILLSSTAVVAADIYIRPRLRLSLSLSRWWRVRINIRCSLDICHSLFLSIVYPPARYFPRLSSSSALYIYTLYRSPSAAEQQQLHFFTIAARLSAAAVYFTAGLRNYARIKAAAAAKRVSARELSINVLRI